MTYENWPYLGVLAVLIAASLGLPLPEDIPLLTGGYLCHTGHARLPVMIGVGMVGVLTGDIILFSLGRRFGHHIVEHRFMRRLVNPSRLLMAENLFARHGVKIIFAGRFLPGLRPMIFMAAGVLRVRFLTFIAVNGLAACISVPTLILLGNLFGNSIEQLQRDIRVVTHVLAGVALVALVIGAIYLHRRQRRLMAEVRTAVPPTVDAGTLAHLPPPVAGDPPDPERPRGGSDTGTRSHGHPERDRAGLGEPGEAATEPTRGPR